MDGAFWMRMHGGATHFPIALVPASVAFDVLSVAVKSDARRKDFRAAGFYLIILGALLSYGAIISGLALSKGTILGTGLMAQHHRFVWPAFGLLQMLAVWRLIVRGRASTRSFRCYLAGGIVTAALLAIAGFWGGEMLLAP